MKSIIVLLSLVFISCSPTKQITQEPREVVTQDTLNNKMVIVISPTKEEEKVWDSETIRTIVAEFFSTIVTVFTIVKSNN